MKWVGWLFSRCQVPFGAFADRGFVHTEQHSASSGQIVTCLRRRRKSTILLFSGLCLDAVMCFFLCVFFIFRQLFSYITKERQTESLVEKLCQRFRTAKWVHLHFLFFSSSHLWPAYFLSFFLESILQYFIYSTYTGVDTWVIEGVFSVSDL